MLSIFNRMIFGKWRSVSRRDQLAKNDDVNQLLFKMRVHPSEASDASSVSQKCFVWLHRKWLIKVICHPLMLHICHLFSEIDSRGAAVRDKAPKSDLCPFFSVHLHQFWVVGGLLPKEGMCQDYSQQQGSRKVKNGSFLQLSGFFGLFPEHEKKIFFASLAFKFFIPLA